MSFTLEIHGYAGVLNRPESLGFASSPYPCVTPSLASLGVTRV